jgi:hypothetical protein
MVTPRMIIVPLDGSSSLHARFRSLAPSLTESTPG